jgi:hypothetical protein
MTLCQFRHNSNFLMINKLKEIEMIIKKTSLGNFFLMEKLEGCMVKKGKLKKLKKMVDSRVRTVYLLI